MKQELRTAQAAIARVVAETQVAMRAVEAAMSDLNASGTERDRLLAIRNALRVSKSGAQDALRTVEDMLSAIRRREEREAR